MLSFLNLSLCVLSYVLFFQQQKRPSLSNFGLPLTTMDSGIIPVSSRNGSPAGSSGLLGVPRENSVSGADVTGDGGSILNGKKKNIFAPPIQNYLLQEFFSENFFESCSKIMYF